MVNIINNICIKPAYLRKNDSHRLFENACSFPDGISTQLSADLKYFCIELNKIFQKNREK